MPKAVYRVQMAGLAEVLMTSWGRGLTVDVVLVPTEMVVPLGMTPAATRPLDTWTHRKRDPRGVGSHAITSSGDEEPGRSVTGVPQS